MCLLNRSPGSTASRPAEKGSSEVEVLLKSKAAIDDEVSNSFCEMAILGASGRWRFKETLGSGWLEGIFTVSWNIWLLFPQSNELLILWDPLAGRNIAASSVVKSMPMPLISVSGSQKGFSLPYIGAVAGADIG